MREEGISEEKDTFVNSQSPAQRIEIRDPPSMRKKELQNSIEIVIRNGVKDEKCGN